MIVPKSVTLTESVARHYDALDLFYRDIWGDHVHHGLWLTGRETPEEAAVNLARHVIRSAGIRSGDEVCDVGCGYGATSRLIAEEYRARVIALTISKQQFDYAFSQRREADNPRYFLRDWYVNDLFPDSFDAVISIESLGHMENKKKFFDEIYRVLRSKGRFVIAAWLSKDNPKRFEVDHLLEPICREGRLLGMGTASEYRNMIRDSGLVDTGFEDLSQRVKKTWPICIARMIKGLFKHAHYRRFIFEKRDKDRIFAATLFRIWLAYETGSMRYGIFTGKKP